MSDAGSGVDIDGIILTCDPLLMAVLESLVESAVAAGRIIEQIARAPLAVREKGAGDPVTEADRAADDFLRKQLPLLGKAAWLSEESADQPERLAADRVWIVDPLDGTKEFVRRIPEYAVAIALVEGGSPVMAVVHNPATGSTFSAAVGKGAWRDGRRLQVAEGNRLLASRSEMRAGEFDAFAGWRIDSIGSIAYKLALVAAGEGAVTLSRGPKWEWDVCAGSLIVSEAAGFVATIHGQKFTFNQRFPKVPGVLAGAPLAVRKIREELRQIGVSERMRELETR
jgi:myo-inositol-1(or 4)-monophosphatase